MGSDSFPSFPDIHPYPSPKPRIDCFKQGLTVGIGVVVFSDPLVSKRFRIPFVFRTFSLRVSLATARDSVFFCPDFGHFH